MKELLVEPLLQNTDNKFTIFPIQYKDIWEKYLLHKRAIWLADEVDCSADTNDWKKLTDDERYFIKHILAFFAASDGIVMENLASNFCNEVQVAEARFFYTTQMYMEAEHSLMYSRLIATYVENLNEQKHLFNAISTFPSITQKAEWAIKWINSKERFAIRLVAFAIVEGIFFSGAFCSIYWISEKKIMPGLCMSNDFIARDEGLHCVAPETLILTKSGYVPIVNHCDKMIEVWNGMEWSSVIPVKTGRNRPVVTVKLNNGMELTCTLDHKWIMLDGSRKETKDLVVSDIICDYKFPKLNAFAVEDAVPTISGLLVSTDQLKLTTMQCPSIKQGDKCLIPWVVIKKLKIEQYSEYYDNIPCESLYISEIVDEDRTTDVYCFTEHYRHSAIFNGILTGQCDFAILLYTKHIVNKIAQEEINQIFKEAVDIEKNFILNALPCKLLGMSSSMMSQYIEFVADRLIKQLGHTSIYDGVKNPFPFMDKICLQNQTNFFDARPSEYQKSASGLAKNRSLNDIDFSMDF